MAILTITKPANQARKKTFAKKKKNDNNQDIEEIYSPIQSNHSNATSSDST